MASNIDDTNNQTLNSNEEQQEDPTMPKSFFVTNSKPIGQKGRSHPLYRTSNSTYGQKEASEIHLPKTYHGTNGGFTKEFVGGMYRDHSLNCNKTRSSVLPDPSFSTNEHFPNEN